ncbi:MAG: hypothetical protein AB8B55_19945, partial [Mariniblastus sp.]
MKTGQPVLTAIALLILSVPFANGQQSISADIKILIPAYANPCCDGGPAMWAQLIESAKDTTRKFELHLILNPASGPAKARDPNYLN